MKCKKGILEKNTLSAVLALAGLVLLTFGFISGCSRILANEEVEAARDTIDLVKGKIDALKGGQTAKPLIRGVESSDAWYLVGWAKGEANAPDIEECFLDSCLCICRAQKNLDLLVVPEDERRKIFASACEDPKSGFCRKMEETELKVQTYSLDIVAEGEYEDREIVGFNEKILKFIKFPDKSLTELELEKKEDSATVSHYSAFYLENKKHIISPGENP